MDHCSTVIFSGLRGPLIGPQLGRDTLVSEGEVSTLWEKLLGWRALARYCDLAGYAGRKVLDTLVSLNKRPDTGHKGDKSS